MSSRALRAVCTCVVAASVVMPALPTMACGPDFSPPVLTQASRPDGPPDAYAAGRLGIVLPTYVQSYLVIAYRYFSGKPLSSDEQRQFVALWNKYHPSDGQQQIDSGDSSAWDSALQAWEQKTNLSVPNATQNSQPNNGMATLPQTYQSYSNCYTDAYATAAKTLAARAAEFGESSSAVQSWIKAQIAVFQNCAAPGTGKPDPATGDLPLEIRKDRDYQIAAADFYGDDWDDAEKEFSAIAADSSSPWRATAALVAVRCQIRKATLGTDDPNERDALFQAADDQLKKIIADASLASVKNGAEELRGFVEFRLQPEQRTLELSDILEQGADESRFGQNLDDYTRLMQVTFLKPDAAAQSDMTEWIIRVRFYTAPSAEADDLQRWQQTHSLAWLVAALISAKADSPQLANMLQASADVPQNSPAYVTLAFERDRLLSQIGREADARGDLDKVLAMPASSVSGSSRNLFVAMRMKLARNLAEFLRDAPRNPVAPWPDYDGLRAEEGTSDTNGPMFDADAAVSLSERVPTSVLMDAARSSTLPPELRREVAIAAWTRAIVLGQTEAARRFAPTLLDTAPSLKDEFAPYLSAQSAKSRDFDAVFILLGTPGLRPYVGTGYSRAPWNAPEDLGQIDGFRDNWWPSMAASASGSTAYDRAYPYNRFVPSFSDDLMYFVYPGGKIPEPGFLTAGQRAAAEKEWSTLASLPSGSDWLVEKTLAWAKARPDDPRLPEALHLAVRATRYVPSDDQTAQLSKRAFDLLHGRYPNSEWTKQTPYWFN